MKNRAIIILFVFASLLMFPLFRVYGSEEILVETTRILLVRHGETAWNREHKIQGSTDVALTEVGREQAEKLAQTLANAEKENIAAIYSSDLERAVDTGLAIGKRLGLEVSIHPGIREMNQGDAESLTKAQKEERYGDRCRYLDETYPLRQERWNYSEVPGAETKNQLLTRVKRALTEMALQHKGQTIVVVTHGSVIATLLTDVTNSTPSFVANCSVIEIHYNHQKANEPFVLIDSRDKALEQSVAMRR